MSEQLRTVPWYDRNPLTILKRFTDVVSPHSLTERWIYSVPEGKKAFLQYVFLYGLRGDAATTSKAVLSQIYYQPNDGSEQIFIRMGKEYFEVKEYETTYLTQCGLYGAGDVFKAKTWDPSVGGQMYLVLIAKFTEFDAFPIGIPFEEQMPAKVDIQQPIEKPWWQWW